MSDDIEFMGRLFSAIGIFGHQIRANIPAKLPVRDRQAAAGSPDIKFGDDHYDACIKRYTGEVSSNNSILLLNFLHAFETRYKENPELFGKHYKKYFVGSDDKWQSALYNLPQIEQPTIAQIWSTISETTITSRLEDLERINLIKRSPVKPPRPKQVWITTRGIEVVRSAIQEAREQLAACFENSAIRQPAESRSSTEQPHSSEAHEPPRSSR